jgi:hypothetical protein
MVSVERDAVEVSKVCLPSENRAANVAAERRLFWNYADAPTLSAGGMRFSVRAPLSTRPRRRADVPMM